MHTSLAPASRPADGPGPSLSALRRAERTAAQLRGAHPSPSGFGGLFAVPDVGEALPMPAFLRGRQADPIADSARAGGRLDNQGRLTCKKLLASLGWEPHFELEAHRRLDAPVVLVRQCATDGVDLDGTSCACLNCVTSAQTVRQLADGWVAASDAADVTGKWELKLTPGLCHAAGIDLPGEVVAFALPAVDGVVVTSTSHAVRVLLDGLDLVPATTHKENDDVRH